MTLGEHIMLLRKQKSLSQAELSKKIGTSGDIIGRYERGVMTPSIEVIIRIADAFDVSMDFLVVKQVLSSISRHLRDWKRLSNCPKRIEASYLT
jgi:transcriptional regulator with XRE-family HTH domain